MATKKINIKATADKIIDKVNRSRGMMSIDIAKFNEKLKGKDAEEFIKEAAEFCGVEIVYL